MHRESWLLYLIVFLMFCDCYHAVPLPRGAVVWSWSAVCDSVMPDHTHLLFSLSNLFDNLKFLFPHDIFAVCSD